ncbi:hypothetical protein [Alteromonas aestuariivivens]|uniref:hypothetical protein n=1 Tax=Alteromonas aestuariivivens TaxID=1938339 RepID=UPI000E1FB683|nr:hypothetical protein [Alteromonas aestuariivivens]
MAENKASVTQFGNPNKSATTRLSAILGATRWAVAIIAPYCPQIRSFRPTKPHSFAIAWRNNDQLHKQ